MDPSNGPQFEPKWEHAFDETMASFQASTTLLGFVRALHTRGHRFTFQRQHPGVTIAGMRYRLARLNQLDLFRSLIKHADGIWPAFETLNAETKAFHGRLTWITLSGFSDDLPDQRRSLERFACFLSVPEIDDAIVKAWASPNVTDRGHRWRYVCHLLHPLMKQRLADRESTKTAFEAAFAQSFIGG